VGWLVAELVGILWQGDPSGVSLSLTVLSFSLRLCFSASLFNFTVILTQTRSFDTILIGHKLFFLGLNFDTW